MGGPAGVGDADGGVNTLAVELGLQGGNSPDGPLDRDSPVVQDGNPGRVVPAILQAFEALDQDRPSRTISDVPYDTAHGARSFLVGVVRTLFLIEQARETTPLRWNYQPLPAPRQLTGL